MNTQLAKKEATAAPSTVVNLRPTETILKTDVLVPSLLLMQGLSEFVNSKKAQQGDIVRSTTGQKVGDDKNPVKIVPLTFLNQWVLFEKVGKKYEFRGTEPRTSANEMFDWDYQKDGADWKRVKALDLYALILSDVTAEEAAIEKARKTGEIPDLSDALVPVRIRFQSTSFSAGRQVINHFAKAQKFASLGAKAHNYYLVLGATQEKNDKGTYYVFDVTDGEKLTPTQATSANEWYNVMTTQKVQVDEEKTLSDTEVAERKAAADRANNSTRF